MVYPFGMSEEEFKLAKQRYQEHKYGAKRRLDVNGNKIAFKLTLEEWLTLWMESGHWHERGCGSGQYLMSRIGDQGDYEPGNIRIITKAQNNQEAIATSKTRAMNLSKANKGRKQTPEHIKAAADARRGGTRSEETKAKMRKPKATAVCHCCEREVTQGSRWHFDKCRGY